MIFKLANVYRCDRLRSGLKQRCVQHPQQATQDRGIGFFELRSLLGDFRRPAERRVRMNARPVHAVAIQQQPDRPLRQAVGSEFRRTRSQDEKRVNYFQVIHGYPMIQPFSQVAMSANCWRIELNGMRTESVYQSFRQQIRRTIADFGPKYVPVALIAVEFKANLCGTVGKLSRTKLPKLLSVSSRLSLRMSS